MNFPCKVYLFVIIAVFAQPVRCEPTLIVPTIEAIVWRLFHSVSLHKRVPDKKILSLWLDKCTADIDFDAREKRVIVHVSRKILKEICLHFVTRKSDLTSALEKTKQLVRDYNDHLSRAPFGEAEIPKEVAGLADFGLMDGYVLFGDPVETDADQEDFIPAVEQNRKTKKCNQQKIVQTQRRRVSRKKRLRRKKLLRVPVKAEDSYGAAAKEGFVSLLKTVFCRFA